jgi:hypothetical protein
MAKKIKARFSQGVFEPLDPATTDFIKDGDEVTLTVETQPSSSSAEWLRETAGGWRDLVDAEALKAAHRARSRLVTRPPVRM